MRKIDDNELDTVKFILGSFAFTMMEIFVTLVGVTCIIVISGHYLLATTTVLQMVVLAVMVVLAAIGTNRAVNRLSVAHERILYD